MGIDRTAVADRQDFSGVRLSLAGPDDILGWSCGEVTEPTTFNSRSGRPEPNGLFCEKIFGPVRDWQCRCGQCHGVKHEGRTCPRCGVSVLHSRVRRQRMGHIELAAPVVHSWFFRTRPSALAALLDLRPGDLERLVYGLAHVVHEPGGACLRPRGPVLPRGALLDDTTCHTLRRTFPALVVLTGAEAVEHLLRDVNPDALARQLRAALKAEDPGNGEPRCAKGRAVLRRLRVVEALRAGGNPAEWMVLRRLPVLPPTLRPMVELSPGKRVTSELNELYRRVIRRNNRLRHLLPYDPPELLLRNEKRLLQQAVDALFDNLRSPRPVLGPRGQPLRSLTDMLTGKRGRFRGNLLGKRVDYSARAVIVVGPELKLHQCGLPRRLALRLYEPFLVGWLMQRGITRTIRRALRILAEAGHLAHGRYRGAALVWDALEEVIRNHPVLLNRAPTLHRMGVMAFEPVLVDGSALRLHPLVCKAFNADFDGDQMAVHLPLSARARVEAAVLLSPVNNLFNPANGQPILTPSQDIVLGCYYLTAALPLDTAEQGAVPAVERQTGMRSPLPPPAQFLPPHTTRGEGTCFASPEEVMLAHAVGRLGVHARIRVRLPEGKTVVSEADGEPAVPPSRRLATTVGRVLFNTLLPAAMPFYDQALSAPRLNRIILDCYRLAGARATLALLDRIKEAGFQAATRSGLSFATDDLPRSRDKEAALRTAEKSVEVLRKAYRRGDVAASEYALQLLKVWAETQKEVARHLLADLEHDRRSGAAYLNPVFVMAASGARGNVDQLRQLAAMRGLMASVSGRIIERSITGSLREGLASSDYFLSAHGARKGLTDRGVRTADAGYLTRKLIDVAQHVVVHTTDCGTTRGVVKRASAGRPLRSLLHGRSSAEDLRAPDGRLLLAANKLISTRQAAVVEAVGVGAVRVRSPFTCEARHGVCRRCYGSDPATGRLVEEGMAVGVVAAQSIGEPGTQLTLRTFHVGGVAGSDIVNDLERVTRLLDAACPDEAAFLAPVSGVILPAGGDDVGNGVRRLRVQPVDEAGQPVGVPHPVWLPADRPLLVQPGERVEAGWPLTEGEIDAVELLEVAGVEAVQAHLLAEVQGIYQHHGLEIDDKHFEVILRQMLRKVQVRSPGDTELLPEQVLDRSAFEAANAALKAGVEPATCRPHLLGITRAAVQSDSFLAAASFQRTVEVLAEAALAGRTDPLVGLKENVILGRLIPAGTGATTEATLEQEDA